MAMGATVLDEACECASDMACDALGLEEIVCGNGMVPQQLLKRTWLLHQSMWQSNYSVAV
jgi:hypothetical protein